MCNRGGALMGGESLRTHTPFLIPTMHCQSEDCASRSHSLMYLVCLNQQHFVTRGERQMCHWPIKLKEGLHFVLCIFDDERVYHTVLQTEHSETDTKSVFAQA